MIIPIKHNETIIASRPFWKIGGCYYTGNWKMVWTAERMIILYLLFFFFYKSTLSR